jgi:hypothetical protein
MKSKWAEDVKRLLRSEMARRGITYEKLANRLAFIGVRWHVVGSPRCSLSNASERSACERCSYAKILISTRFAPV